MTPQASWRTGALRKLIETSRAWLGAFGLDPVRLLFGLRGLPQFVSDYFRIRKLLRREQPQWPLKPSVPCLADRYLPSGTTRGHYFRQDLFVARRIFERRPEVHMDVGSRVDGFVAHVACFREIQVFDIRPLADAIPNIRFVQQDIVNLPPSMHGVTDSLSCLHALEHFGLGRYGDPLMADGHVHGFRSLATLLQPGGILYLSVPIGQQRIEFNGHRIFAVPTILELAAAQFDVECFSYIDDEGSFHENVVRDAAGIATSFDLIYGCGIFELRKKALVS